MLTRGSLRSTPLTSRFLPRGGAHPKRILLAALVAALMTGLLVSSTGVRAQAVDTFQTRDTVPPGGIMTVTVSTANVFILASSPVSGCPVTGTGGATVTYTCAATSGGIFAGTPITQTFSVASGLITELVTYNQNGGTTGIPGFPAVTAASTDIGTCTAGPNSTCGGVITSVVTVPNSRVDLIVTAPAGQTVQIVSPTPSTLGTCTEAVPPPSIISPVAGSTTFSYNCSASQSVPQGTGVSGVSVTVSAAGTPTFKVIDNALFPLPAIPAIPPATTQTISFGSAAGPILSSINPSSGTSGTVVTLQGSGLTGVTAVNFGNLAATNVNCVSGGTSCTVTAPSLATGTTAIVTVVTSNGTSGSLAFDYTSGTTPPTGGISISYAAGWNIVGGPSGTVVTGNNGPLYTYQAGDTAYEVVTSGSPLTAPRGYWAYFNSATTSSIVTASPQTLTVNLPALQWIMVSNPGNTSATLSGADIVYTYNGSIYVAATSLLPGQGGWAISTNGGTLTIRN